MTQEIRELQVGDWVGSLEWNEKSVRRISRIEGQEVWFDVFDQVGSGLPPIKSADSDEPWFIKLSELFLVEHTPVDKATPKPKEDSLDVKLFSVHRSAPSKGYEIALFPGAPFGSEVVLSLRERGEWDVEVEVETPEGKEEFVSLIMGAVTVLMDLHTAEEIAAALYRYVITDGADTPDLEIGEEVQS